MILTMQTLPLDEFGGRYEAGICTYNPAVRKIPVKMLFCFVDVRRRHSRGTGLGSQTLIGSEAGVASYQANDRKV